MESAKILERMKKRGLRVTQPRRIILDDLNTAKEYVSAEEIYLRIHPKHPKIGLATVYRTLTLLTQIGIVTKFEFGEGKARYELVDENDGSKYHHILVCENCFTVEKYTDFSAKEKKGFEQLEHSLEDHFDFDIERHVVHYYGLCKNCRKKRR